MSLLISESKNKSRNIANEFNEPVADIEVATGQFPAAQHVQNHPLTTAMN